MKKKVILSLMILVLVSSFYFLRVSESQGSLGPIISLSFDDGNLNQYTVAWPIMKERGIVGTFYIVADWISPMPAKMSWNQIIDLKIYGNEIGSHSKTHSRFTELTEFEIRDECGLSKEILESQLGHAVNNFAYPFGASNDFIDEIVNDYYRSGRYNGGLLDLPVTDFHIHHYGWDWSLDQYKEIVDRTYSTKKWAVLNFHNIGGDITGGAWITAEDFAGLLDYILSKGIPILTVNQALNLGQSPTPTPTPTSKVFTELTVDVPSDISAGEDISVNGVLKGEYSPSLSLKGSIKGATITLSTAWGTEKTTNTDSDGKYSFNVAMPTESGSYSITVSFEGDEFFTSSQATKIMTVISDSTISPEADVRVEFRLDGKMRFVFIVRNPTDEEVVVSKYRMTRDASSWWCSFWRIWRIPPRTTSEWAWGWVTPDYYNLGSGTHTVSIGLLTEKFGVLSSPERTFEVP